MTDSVKVLVQELESAKADIAHLVQKVECMVQDMRLLGKWQHTMDMTLKNSLENN